MINESLSIVTFLWNDGFRDYKPKYVNALAKDIKRHCSFPYTFICVYDQVPPKGFDLNYVKPIQLPDSAKWTRGLKNPKAERLPTSYRRLWAFSNEAKYVLGDRILLLDIDCLVVDDLRPLIEYSDTDFVGWKPRLEFPGRKPSTEPKRIGGGTWLLRTGTHPWIWENFSVEGTKKAKEAGWRGSDQGWLSYNLANKCVTWPKDVGIYNNQETRLWDDKIPENAKIIHFNGKIKPWDTAAKSKPWFYQGLRSKKIFTHFTFNQKDEKITVVCFWWGNWCGGHGPQYVSKLYESLKKHTTIPFDFVCLTDSPHKIDVPCQAFEPKYRWNLNKLQAYNLDSDRIITFDLDTIILKNIDFILADRDTFTTNESFGYKEKCGGGIVSCQKEYGKYLLETLKKHKKTLESVLGGSERFFYRKYVKNPKFWQKKYSGIYSYKKHCQDEIPEDAKIIHMHGNPRPHMTNLWDKEVF